MRIYIAGPYSSDDPQVVENNVRRAKQSGMHLLSLGHFPFIPHLNHWFDKECGQGMTRENYLEWDMEYLKVCDALFFLGHSPGAARELAFAKKTGMPIFYELASVPKADAVRKMSEGQEAHLTRLKRIITQRMDAKYRKGQAEHGGDLFRKSGLMAEACDEAVDLFVYIQTELDMSNGDWPSPPERRSGTETG